MSRLSREIEDLKRGNQIIHVFFKYGFSHYLRQFEFKSLKFIKEKKLEEEQFPRKLRLAFEELGATFIKLGQLISLRPDLLPKKYCDEFKNLQDNVKPFQYTTLKKIIESELKSPIQKHFSKIDKKPLAAASIGQVHCAELLDGTKVVIKVQRPNIRKIIEADIDILKSIARLVKKKINQKIFDPEQIISEFEEYTEFELDYHHEARNVEIIYNNFKNHKTKIPKVYRDLCTDKILVMEYIDGHNLLDSILTKKGKKEVSKKIADTLQKQIFVDGVFHADPHPGNIFVTKGNNIAFIDFGIVGFIGDELRENLISLLIAAIAKDVEGIAAVITSIGATKEDINIDDFRRDLSQCMSIYYETEIKEIKMDEIIHSVITICNDYKIILPKNFVLLAKCIITTESVIYDFDPNFNPIKNAKPFVMDLIKSRYNPKKIFKNLGTNVRNVKNFITKIPKISNDLVTGLEKGEYYVKKIHKDMNILNNEIDRSSKRVSLAMIATALIIASAFLVTLDQTKIMGISLISFIGFSLASLFLFFLLISMIHQN